MVGSGRGGRGEVSEGIFGRERRTGCRRGVSEKMPCYSCIAANRSESIRKAVVRCPTFVKNLGWSGRPLHYEKRPSATRILVFE